ncbi:MAG: hypothetical protein PVJ39_04680 [Gammaproteobacteria bacterium]|jgi:hypothetical protein
MSIKPILFNTEMVRAILDGRKTQTRRVVSPQPEWVFAYGEPEKPDETAPCEFTWWVPQPSGEDGSDVDWSGQTIKAPMKPGDRLYVRETFSVVSLYREWGGHYPTTVHYKADNLTVEHDLTCDEHVDQAERFLDGSRSFPSIHMPRWAARLFLEITAVRVERLQDIKPHECIAEGIAPASLIGYDFEVEDNKWAEWISLWNSVSRPGEQWDDNPWVWVYEFKRIDGLC